MDRTPALVRLLADGGLHSGEAIAAELGMTRAGVWKSMGRLRERLGLTVESVRGQGYRLPAPLELLDARRPLRNQEIGRAIQSVAVRDAGGPRGCATRRTR